MSGETISFTYGKTTFTARVERRERKTLAIAVLPDGAIEVTAPVGVSEGRIRERLKKRARWIGRQREYFAQFQPRTPERRFVSGETHLYLGRKYRLKLAAGPVASVKLRGGRIHVTCKDGDAGLAGKLLRCWYRERAEVKFRERMDRCMEKFRNHAAPELAIRQLKKRWGSLSPSGRMTLNADLVRAPVECIDYVIIHELCHMEHPHHGPAFTKLLGTKLDGWREIKHRLELRLG